MEKMYQQMTLTSDGNAVTVLLIFQFLFPFMLAYNLIIFCLRMLFVQTIPVGLILTMVKFLNLRLNEGSRLCLADPSCISMLHYRFIDIS